MTYVSKTKEDNGPVSVVYLGFIKTCNKTFLNSTFTHSINSHERWTVHQNNLSLCSHTPWKS